MIVNGGIGVRIVTDWTFERGIAGRK